MEEIKEVRQKAIKTGLIAITLGMVLFIFAILASESKDTDDKAILYHAGANATVEYDGNVYPYYGHLEFDDGDKADVIIENGQVVKIVSVYE